MKILHVVPGLDEPNNGIAVAAKLIARGQSKSGAEVEVVEARDFVRSNIRTFEHYSEVWVHSMWLPRTISACWKVMRAGKRLVRMTHANLDPLRLGYHGWKKRLVAPIERWFLRRSDWIVATCEAEREWIRAYAGKGCPGIVVEDLKRFFNLEASPPASSQTLHLLYLGRRHPLKGVEFLEQAVREIGQTNNPGNRTIDLRIVSDHFGEELERDWDWCDVLVLPTLSENFGLVVAEALERGKYVITTDGAPAWDPGADSPMLTSDNYTYIRGYRKGTDEERVRLLKDAIATLV